MPRSTPTPASAGRYWLDAGEARDRLDAIVDQLRATGWDDEKR
jgi:hypothetical protein